jgi:hypothetical protein
MTEDELDEIESRCQRGDLSRAKQDMDRLIEEIRTLKGFIDQAGAEAAKEVLRNPPIP